MQSMASSTHSRSHGETCCLFRDKILSVYRFKYPTNSIDEMSIHLHSEVDLQSGLLEIMPSIRKAATWLGERCRAFRDDRSMNFSRVAFLYAGRHDIRLIPLYIHRADDIGSKWTAIHSDETPKFYSQFPGFITSVDGPPASAEALDKIQELYLRAYKRESETIPQADVEWSYRFDGDCEDNNLFAKLVRGEIPQRRIWESKTHVAFLTPFPNVVGCTVVIPRKHLSSDVFALDENDFESLMCATQAVIAQIHRAFSNHCHEYGECQTVGIIFEGYEIDYTHVKLYPIMTAEPTIQNSSCNDTADFHSIRTQATCTKTYRGHLTSKFGPRQFAGDDDYENCQL